MAAGKAAGRILCDPEQGRQGLLPHHHVQGLFHQRKPFPLAEPEHHRRKLCHRAALHPSPGKGSRVLLFVREFKAEARFGGAGAYTYLGTVNYVKHEGSRPMNITWKLDRPIPAKFLKKTNKLIVG